MPEINTMGNSRYLKKEELSQPTVFTVTEVVQEDVSMETEPEKLRWIAKFKETDKGLVLNQTNLENGAIVSGHTNTDNWVGQKFVLFNDLSVKFGQTRGGIRIQIPQQAAAPYDAGLKEEAEEAKKFAEQYDLPVDGDSEGEGEGQQH